VSVFCRLIYRTFSDTEQTKRDKEGTKPDRILTFWDKNQPKNVYRIAIDTAQRLARYFGGDPVSWLNLQAMYDLKTLPTHDEIMQRVQPRQPTP
jgi:hypothetical protein